MAEVKSLVPRWADRSGREHLESIADGYLPDDPRVTGARDWPVRPTLPDDPRVTGARGWPVRPTLARPYELNPDTVYTGAIVHDSVAVDLPPQQAAEPMTPERVVAALQKHPELLEGVRALLLGPALTNSLVNGIVDEIVSGMGGPPGVSKDTACDMVANGVHDWQGTLDEFCRNCGERRIR